MLASILGATRLYSAAQIDAGCTHFRAGEVMRMIVGTDMGTVYVRSLGRRYTLGMLCRLGYPGQAAGLLILFARESLVRAAARAGAAVHRVLVR